MLNHLKDSNFGTEYFMAISLITQSLFLCGYHTHDSLGQNCSRGKVYILYAFSTFDTPIQQLSPTCLISVAFC